MTAEQKKELAREMLENMDLTKEQYIQMCKLCDDLGLAPKPDESVDPENMDWADILGEEAE